MSVEEIAPRSGRSSQVKGPLVGEQQGEGSEELAAKVGEGRATLRLKQNGQAVVEQVVSIQPYVSLLQELQTAIAWHFYCLKFII